MFNKLKISFFVMLLFGSGCQGLTNHGFQGEKYIKNGKKYGVVKCFFRHEWWNYYERGLSFADGDFFEEAKQDIQKALTIQEGDTWRTELYGDWYSGYFPHRELGIIYYHMGEMENAIKELKYSLKCVETEKGKKYLALTKALIKSKQEYDLIKDDVINPIINISDMGNGLPTYLDHTIITVHAWDNNQLKSVFINDDNFLKSPKKQIYFTHILDLPKTGKNLYTIKAMDKSKLDNSIIFEKVKKEQNLKYFDDRLCLFLDNFKVEKIGLSPIKSTPLPFNVLKNICNDKRKRFQVYPGNKILKNIKNNKYQICNDYKGMSSDYQLLGSIVEREKSYELYIEVIDLETKKKMAVFDVIDYTIDENILQRLSQKVFIKLSYYFPFIGGRIKEINDEEIIMEFNDISLLKNGMKLIVYKDINSNNKSINEDQIIGEIRIFKIQNKMALAKISYKLMGTDLNTDLLVYTK